ncbi:alpha/beta fold hydrolase [Alkalimonas sp.]|uniref:alpha/beta hydrolase family protein n=1 Tax=Alkalimonas sp. TaxID=1872453 RepID=UPI00263AA383|nr:alpha/beta fold hydrolase [Alkalimonas sp.]MCC5825165.1 alpha/beta fold hydrolase [Alkalimonas sp.]
MKHWLFTMSALAWILTAQAQDIEVTVSTPDPAVTLAGTLVIPDGVSTAPVAILLTGSGDHVRDGIISGTPMFKEMSDYLKRHGIASLRLDDRGTGQSTGPSTRASTTADRVTDMVAVIDFLQEQQHFQLSQLGLIGFSEGAMIAPQVANARTEAVDWMILLGTPALPGEVVWVDQQVANFARQFGEHSPRLPMVRELLQQIVALSVAGGSMEHMEKLVIELFELGDIAEAQAREQGMIEGFSRTVLDPWMSFFFSYDPRPALTQVQQPVLAVYGSLDTLTSARVNAPELMQALLLAPTQDFTVQIMPDQDHFFLRSDELAPGEHAFGKMHLAPQLTERMQQWLQPRLP